MKQQKEFSIQDWKSNHFYKLVEGVDNPTPEQMDILRAIQDMVQAGDSTILDLIKDRMEAEWGDAPETGKQGPWSQNYNDTDDMENMNLQEAVDLKSLFPAVDQGDMDNDFFITLFDALDNYFEVNADELTNMDAKYLAHICRQASKTISNRSSN